MVSIALDAEEASKVAEILLHLAALIDPDDPDGLRDAYGRRSERLEEHLRTRYAVCHASSPGVSRRSAIEHCGPLACYLREDRGAVAERRARDRPPSTYVANVGRTSDLLGVVFVTLGQP